MTTRVLIDNSDPPREAISLSALIRQMHYYAAHHMGRYPKAVFADEVQAKTWARDADAMAGTYALRHLKVTRLKIMGAAVYEADCPVMFSEETQ